MKKIIFLFFTIYCVLIANKLCFSQNDSSYKYLEINTIQAKISSNGLLFWPGKKLISFNVPNGGEKSSNFSSCLWVGGKDKLGKLHLAADEYTVDGHDYHYGPIMDSVNYKKYQKQWNNTWKINKSTIDSFKIYWSTPGYKIPFSITSWPGNGDTTLGESIKLAPYFDNDNDGHYNPAKGDYPIIRGDQAVYFIINDDSIHTNSKGQKLKIEIHGMAYAFSNPTDTALNHSIFLNYQIINHSENNYDSVYIGVWDDIDIGWAYDDYFGCDTLLNSFFGYNGDNVDGQGQSWTYGINPPALAVTLLNKKMNSFTYYINSPDSISIFNFIMFSNEYYNSLKGLWKNGKNMVYGGNGYSGNGTTNQKTQYAFPGDPSDSTQWSMVSIKNVPSDYMGTGSIGPMTFNEGEIKCLDIAYVWARNDKWNNIENVTLLKQRIDSIINFYNNNYTNDCDDLSINSISHLNGTANNVIKVFPNPANNYILIEQSNNHFETNYTLYNLIGQKINSGKINYLQTRINVNGLSDGMYILNVSDNRFNQSFKILINH